MADLRYRYQTLELGDHDIHLRTLRDNQQFQDDQGVAEALGISSAAWPIFGVLWGAGHALARLMVDYDVDGRRVLEVGCGIGLASLVLNERDCDITATDRHPSAHAFLDHNTDLNEARAIPFERTDWDDHDDDLGLFDLIIASDVLYEAHHGLMLGDFIERHAEATCSVVVFDSSRGHAGKLTQTLLGHGFSHERARAEPGDDPDNPYRGQVHSYER